MTLEQTYQLILLFEGDSEIFTNAKNGEPIEGFDLATISTAMQVFCDPYQKSQFLFTYLWSEDSL